MVEVVERERCEPRPGRHREQIAGTDPQHGGGAPVGVPEQLLQRAEGEGRLKSIHRQAARSAGARLPSGRRRPSAATMQAVVSVRACGVAGMALARAGFAARGGRAVAG